MTIDVMLNGETVSLDRDVFASLFENSVAADRAPVRTALERNHISFRDLIEMATVAEIPYPLFFAPADVVLEQIRLKNEKLMAGFTKPSFSMNSRNIVRLADVELIVKDLLRKQMILRADTTLTRNTVVSCLGKPGTSVQEDADTLRRQLGFTNDDLKAARSKEAALELLISALEARQILVGRSAKNHMPQQMPRRARFSGMTIKDARVPYIFLASGDEGERLEPSGRKVFTLVLLTVMVARGTFAPVTYDGHTKDETAPREFDIAGEVLLPSSEIRTLDLESLAAVKDAANLYKVTPSALAMRARRLNLLPQDTFREHMDQLADEYARRIDPPRRNAKPVNALRKYNGTECSRRMLGLLDAGEIGRRDFCRVMFSNKLKPAQIDDFRAAVR